jgi:heme exporter protein D
VDRRDKPGDDDLVDRISNVGTRTLIVDRLQAFLSMGGYGAFVWPSFLVTGAVLAGLLALSLRSLRSRERALSALESEPREPAREAQA